MEEGPEEQGRNNRAASVPSIDLSKVVWEASLHYERNKGPELPAKSTMLLEDAATELVRLYNGEYDAEENAEAGSTSRWILPECAAKGVMNVRKIEAGDVFQIRKYWEKNADRGYFTQCAFVYDGQRAVLHMDSSTPELADQFRAGEQKVQFPETVGDFANMNRSSENDLKFVNLEISRYGRPANKVRQMRGRGRSRTAAWAEILPPAKGK